MYVRFGAMIATSMIVMFLLTYTNSMQFEHVRWSEERFHIGAADGWRDGDRDPHERTRRHRPTRTELESAPPGGDLVDGQREDHDRRVRHRHTEVIEVRHVGRLVRNPWSSPSLTSL